MPFIVGSAEGTIKSYWSGMQFSMHSWNQMLVSQRIVGDLEALLGKIDFGGFGSVVTRGRACSLNAAFSLCHGRDW